MEQAQEILHAKLAATIVMSVRGKLVALEGIDGSGKHTQLAMLSRALRRRGIAHATISFPCYDGFFGRVVARYLNGEFGSLAQVDPHFSALLYAGDRLEHAREIEAQLSRGKWVLADRYAGSNFAHQGARVPARRNRREFLRWLEKLEYGIYGIPRADFTLYLRVDPALARQLVERKPARKYTRRKRDLQEANFAHLREAARVYDELAREERWRVVECMTGAQILPPEEIHLRILEALGPFLRGQLRGQPTQKRRGAHGLR